MDVKKFLKPKKEGSSTIIRNYGFSNTASSQTNNGITSFANVQCKELTTNNLDAVNANITNLTTKTFINNDGAYFNNGFTSNGNVKFSNGEVDLEDVAVKLGLNNTFDELIGSDTSKLYANDITCDYLTVNKKAHFFELVIDKIKTVGGTIIFTPADGFTIDKVVEGNDDYILFWRACTEVAEGEIGDTISETGQTMTEPVSVNMWQEWDQALCQSFNLGNESDYYYDVSNRYWWRVVESASDEPEIQEINGVKYYCHWIMVYKNGTSSTTGKPLVDTGSDVPAVGDAVSMLGYRYDEIVNYTQDDINRASAIIIAAYKTPDSGIVPPSYAQYQNITDFRLSTYRKSYFDATGAKIYGEFVVNAGGNNVNLDDYIQSFNNANPLEAFITTNSNQSVDLIVLQTDQNDEIDSLNNFPNNMQVMVNYNGSPQMQISNYDVLQLTLFGITYDLLDANNYTPSLPSGYEGIYVSNITKSNYNPFNLTFAFTGNSQTITTDNMSLYVEITDNGTTYNLAKSISINSVKSVEGVDAEYYGLNVVKEDCKVNANQTLQPELIYNLKYIEGTTVTYPAPTTQTLQITTYKDSGNPDVTTVVWDIANNQWRFYPTATSNYYTHTSENPVPVYYKIELLDGNDVLDTRLVYVQLSPISLFSIQEGLTQSIQAEATARGSQYSALTQTVEGLNTTVSQTVANVNTISGQINDINGDISDINGDISDINGDITTINGEITSIQTNVSTIDQKADRIGLHVDTVETDLNTLETNIERTGIDIEQGKITITAENTDIQGNLNIHNANEGLVIYDNATNTAKIAVQGSQIGTLSDFISNGSFVYTQFATEAYLNSGTVTYPLTGIGTFNAGNKITVSIMAYRVFGGSSITNVNYTYQLLNGNTVVSSSSGTTTAAGENTWDINIPQWTIQSQGQYNIQLTLSVTGGDEGNYFGVMYSVRQYMSIVQKIGTDGAFFGTATNRLAWFGSDLLRLAYDNNYIEVNSTGAYYRTPTSNIPTELGSTTTVHRCTTGYYYEAQLTDGLITVCPGTWDNSGWFTVYLPYPFTVPGKIYYIKNYSSNDVRVGVNSSEKYMMDDDSTSTENFRDVGKRAYYFISDGFYWLIYYAT